MQVFGVTREQGQRGCTNPEPRSAGCRREACLSPAARPQQSRAGWRELSEIVNHCFLAGCLPSLIQVAITHSEYLATN